MQVEQGSSNYSQTTFMNSRRMKYSGGANASGISFDDTERRTRPTSYTSDHNGQSFWELTSGMEKPDQMNMAASYLIAQLLKSGATQENQEFADSLRSRFNQEELQSIKEGIRQHPILRNRSKFEVEGLLNQLENLWPCVNQPSRAEEPAHKDLPAKSPDEIFFQTVFLAKPSSS